MEKSEFGPGYLRVRLRNTLFTLLGVVVLLLKRNYTGAGRDFVQSYAGNFFVSFAVYFLMANIPSPPRLKRVLSAALALAAVELFEATNGFGVMSNTYDPGDFLANALGIALAIGVDILTDRKRGTT
jgi:hypothetical protein